MAIEWRESGDLFAEKVEALVNPVNCAGVMGTGLAAEFKRRWPENYAFYREAWKAGIVERGFVLPFQIGPLADGPPYYIFNFPTKLDWRDPSRLSYIEEGLHMLPLVLHIYCVESVVIPALGCGCGGLNWPDVRPLIERILMPATDSTRIIVFAPQ